MLRLRALAFVVVFAACHAPESRPPQSGELRDDFGTAIDLQHAPRRIVSLNPTTTEILFAIGASNRLVGRSQWDVFPDSALTVPSLGQALRPNVEALIAAKPDLVVLYASNDNRPAFDRLKQAGIATVAFKIDSIEQFARDARIIGRITGDSARAGTLVDSIEATLARVRAATASLPHPTVFIHAWDKPIIAIGGGSFMSQLLEIAGARNSYADIVAASAPVTLEDIVQRNPDYVMASPVAAPKIRMSASWRSIPAVRSGHLLVYDTVLVGRPSVMLGMAAVSLAKLLHPGVVR
ncbi:MAG: ABC-type transporter, periplasmic subunit [Gemmatimonadetes bacterium]|nr:ABC-type transporter, periplasmic subunit [Gemmatimonadota bacterium]